MASERGGRAQRRTAARWTAVAACLIVLVAARWADRRDRVIGLELTCATDGCRAVLDGGAPLHLPATGRGRGARIGLYAYSPWDDDSPQLFRDLSVEAIGGPAKIRSLRRAGDVPPELLGRGWEPVPRRGLRAGMPQGDRSALLLASPRAERFTLRVELVSPSDAGVMFHASDPRNGTVFAVRPRHNDAFFFTLERGRPGPILVLGPVAPLSVGRELLRLAGLGAGILIAAVFAVSALAWLARRLERLLPPPRLARRWWRSRRRLAVAVGVLLLFGAAAPAAVALLALDAVPHIPDETAYLFQAKIFAAGKLWAPPPPVPEFFLHEHVLLGADRWFVKYPPLYPALLALGVAVGAPWLVNALLASLTGLVTFLFAWRLAGRRWGLVAWALMLSSPFFLIMGGSLMAHTAAALFVTLFVWLAHRAFAKPRDGTALLAGVALGLALCTRPYTALLATLPVAVYLALRFVRGTRPRLTARAAIGVAAGAGVLVAVFLAWNGIYAAPGRTQLELHTAYHATDTLGFGADKGAGWLMTWGSWGHTPAKALRSVHQYLDYSSGHLLGWPWMLSLSLVVAHFVWGRVRTVSWMLLGLPAALAIGHMGYWATQHLVYGARYWFSATPALMVLSALGLRSVVRHAAPGVDRGLWKLVLALALGAATLFNAALYLPERLAELPRYGGVGAGLRNTVEREGLRDAVVFVTTQGLMFNDGFHLNDPFLRDGCIFARDLGRQNAALLEHYPGLRPYRWDGRSLTRLSRSVADVPLATGQPAAAFRGREHP